MRYFILLSMIIMSDFAIAKFEINYYGEKPKPLSFEIDANDVLKTELLIASNDEPKIALSTMEKDTYKVAQVDSVKKPTIKPAQKKIEPVIEEVSKYDIALYHKAMIDPIRVKELNLINKRFDGTFPSFVKDHVIQIGAFSNPLNAYNFWKKHNSKIKALSIIKPTGKNNLKLNYVVFDSVDLSIQEELDLINTEIGIKGSPKKIVYNPPVEVKATPKYSSVEKIKPILKQTDSDSSKDNESNSALSSTEDKRTAGESLASKVKVNKIDIGPATKVWEIKSGQSIRSNIQRWASENEMVVVWEAKGFRHNILNNYDYSAKTINEAVAFITKPTKKSSQPLGYKVYKNNVIKICSGECK